MKVLFIKLDIGNAPTGGVVIQKRNLSIYEDLFGKQNVDCISLQHLKYPTLLQKTKRAICRFILANTWEMDLEQYSHILKISKKYDVIHIDTSILGYLVRDIRNNGYSGIVNIFFHNVEYTFNTVISKKYGAFSYFYSNPLRRSEKMSCAYANNILALNERDAKQIQAFYKRKVSCLIPVTLKDTYKPYKSIKNDKLVLLFVGSYFFANVTSLIWFDKNVAPYLKNTKIIIVGTNMSKIKKQLTHNELFEIHDYVEDLGVYYQKASAVILPIFEGGGMKIKTCEALMWGKYILGTTEAFQGYPITDEEGCINDCAETFITTINNFAKVGIESYCPASRKLYLDHFSNERAIERISELLQ